MEDLDPSLFAQRPSVIGKTNDEQTQKKQKEIAMLEAQVYHLVELLSEQRQATKDNIVRKQARGYAEVLLIKGEEEGGRGGRKKGMIKII